MRIVGSQIYMLFRISFRRTGLLHSRHPYSLILRGIFPELELGKYLIERLAFFPKREQAYIKTPSLYRLCLSRNQSASGNFYFQHIFGIPFNQDCLRLPQISALIYERNLLFILFQIDSCLCHRYIIRLTFPLHIHKIQCLNGFLCPIKSEIFNFLY